MQAFKRGVWFCSVCGNHNYQREKACRWTWCPTMTFKPGDWLCPACGNHNYAKRLVCNTKTCKLPKL